LIDKGHLRRNVSWRVEKWSKNRGQFRD
jgi:hypothetical protein